MARILITGASGFFGEILKNEMPRRGHEVVNVDLQVDSTRHPALVSFRGDIRDRAFLEREVFGPHRFDAVIHPAAILAHAVKDRQFSWESNVE
jgi:nucleoside-diphosphate-sugar epimerase